MASKHINENYIHDCGETKTNPDIYTKSILDMGFTPNEVMEILDFYLFHAIALSCKTKQDKTVSKFGLKSLADYKWTDSASMLRLEGRLLKAANIGIFCIIKADSINETLEQMNLKEKICIEHPRAVMMQKYSVTVHQDETSEIKPRETRMLCLFRHIRNSFAHNQTYLFNNGKILLEDRNENDGNITAKILMPKEALLKWMKIVKEGDKKNEN